MRPVDAKLAFRKPPPAITPTVVAGAAHAAAVQTTASKASQQPVISPKLTRARKKMRCLSDAEAFDQLEVMIETRWGITPAIIPDRGYVQGSRGASE